MNARAYYNEIDPAACAVLRELIARGVIADGDVDDQSIKDVRPANLAGYTQHHFFAGGGLWSVAARLAGWPDDRALWTASCPCQGESLAGKRLGADDPRHLWPDLYRLIRARRPAVVVGEQVAAAAGTHWLDGVCLDLDAESYAARAIDIPACAVDAPHQRQRLWWAALDDRCSDGQQQSAEALRARRHTANDADVDDRERARLERQRGDVGRSEGWSYSVGSTAETDGELFADAANGYGGLQPDANKSFLQGQSSARQQSLVESDASAFRNGSFWADSEWIVSPLDGKARRAKPGIPFLVDGLPGRVDLWRIGGNAVSPILAAEVIAALRETIDGY